MLVLSRQVGESLRVGDSLVTITSIDSEKAGLKVTSAEDGAELQIATLKKDESISYGDRIYIVIVETRKTDQNWKVRLGIEAPKEMPVHRKEVYDAIKRVEPERKESS